MQQFESMTKEQLIVELHAAKKQITEQKCAIEMMQTLQREQASIFHKLGISRIHLDTLLEFIPVGVSIATDASCIEILHNPVLAKILRVEAWENVSCSADIPPAIHILRDGKELLPEEMPIQRSAWFGEEIDNDELEFIWDDGVRKLLAWSSRPLYRDSDNIVGAIATCIDITNRMQNEENLKYYREQLEKLVEERTRELENAQRQTIDILESITDSFYALDSNLRFIYANQSAKRSLNLLEGALIGRKVEEVIPTAIFTLEIIHRVLREKRSQHYEIFSKITSRWVDVNVYSTSDGVAVYYQDIDDRKKAEEALRQSEELFQQIFRGSPGMIAILRTKDNKYMDVNQNFLEVTEYTWKEVVERTPEELNLWVDDQDVKNSLISEFKEKGKVNNVQFTFKTKSGEKISTLASATKVSLNGEICRITIFKDITKEKKMEAELARLDRLNIVGEMAAGIGHEIRNPMTTVRGYLQMFQRKALFSEYRGQLDTMIGEIDRANLIITEYLSLAKDKIIDLKPGNLNNAVNALFPLIQAHAFRQGHEIQKVTGDIPEILCNENEIRQLLLNFTRNALEAIPNKGLVIIKTFTNGNKVVLSVEDTGIGIPQHVMDRLGIPFVTTKDNGTGLGLSICYGIAQRHGAKIDVTTSTTGTTFYVSFNRLQPSL